MAFVPCISCHQRSRKPDVWFTARGMHHAFKAGEQRSWELRSTHMGALEGLSVYTQHNLILAANSPSFWSEWSSYLLISIQLHSSKIIQLLVGMVGRNRKISFAKLRQWTWLKHIVQHKPELCPYFQSILRTESYIVTTHSSFSLLFKRTPLEATSEFPTCSLLTQSNVKKDIINYNITWHDFVEKSDSNVLAESDGLVTLFLTRFCLAWHDTEGKLN